MTENKLTVNANSKTLIESQVMENTDFSIGENKKVLGMTAVAQISGIEALNNELRVAIRTIFRITYLAEGGAVSLDNKVDNVYSIYKEGINPSTKACLKATVTDCEYISGSKIKGNATIEISGWFLMENKMEFLDACKEGVFCKTEAVKVESVNLLDAKAINLTNTFEARLPLAKILDYKAEAVISGVYPMNGSYQLEGEISLRVVALSDTNQFISQNFSQPFNTEIMEASITADSVIDVEATVKEVTLQLTDTDNRTIICDMGVGFCAAVNSQTEIMGITDTYSTTNELTLESACFKLNTSYCYRVARDKTNISYSFAQDINEICCLTSPMASAMVNTSEKNVTVEGLITTTLIYLDENNEYASSVIELPYKTLVAKDFECDTHLKPRVIVTNLSARLRAGREADINAELLIWVRGVSSKEICLVSSLEIGGEKEVDDYAISLYIVKPNETLWEVAKALNTEESTILELNKELKLPLKGGERVLLYKPINIEF